MSNVLISVRDLSVAYEGTTALDEVSLDIFEDDFLGVIGPNGGGKTSLVRAILGNIPYCGTVNYAAELFRGKERLIGYLPQQNVFDRAFPISVTETVLSGLQGHKRFRSRYTAEDRRRALELLERTGIARSRRPSHRRNIGRADAAGASVPGDHLRAAAADPRRTGQLRRQPVRK